MNGNLKPRPPRIKAARSNVLTVYYRQDGRFVASTTNSPTATLRPRAGALPEAAAPLVAVGRAFPQRLFVAALRELADAVEYNHLEGPGDYLALFGDPCDDERSAG